RSRLGTHASSDAGVASSVAIPLRTAEQPAMSSVAATTAPAVKDETRPDSPSTEVDDSPSRDGRGENSLAVLCHKFCELYRDHRDAINIDVASKNLGIQRRRMYEILNIVQSVGLVSRIRSSLYRWEGYSKMTVTLHRLKEEGMRRKRKAAQDTGSHSPEQQRNSHVAGGSPSNRRKAVATILGERFVQIFLCNEFPQPIVLEDIMGVFASCVGGALTNQTCKLQCVCISNHCFRWMIENHSYFLACARRLYDIANVFCSMGLVKKTWSVSMDHGRKKRLYEWIGPTGGAGFLRMRVAIANATASAEHSTSRPVLPSPKLTCIATAKEPTKRDADNDASSESKQQLYASITCDLLTFRDVFSASNLTSSSATTQED
ncbi:TPA: hypothetical protein N0F65_000971, partial [Lagenidium giganteum]